MKSEIDPPMDAYLRKEHSCQMSSWSDLKQHSLRLFEDGRPNKKNNKKNKKMS